MAILLFALTGCESPSPSPKAVGILLYSDARLPQYEGLRAGLAEAGWLEGLHVRYIQLNAHNQKARLKELAGQLIARHVDLLVAAGGLEADTLRPLAVASGIPLLVLYANSIETRGLVESREQVGWSVTGVDNLNAELSGKRVELLHQLLPDARRILILYDPNIPPSREGLTSAMAAARLYDLDILARPVRRPQDTHDELDRLTSQSVDAILTVPTAHIDGLFRSALLPRAQLLGIPVFSHLRLAAQEGALASFGPDPYELGEQAARLAIHVLEGLPAEHMPFETPFRLHYVINDGTRHALGITLPSVTRQQVTETLGIDG